MGVTSPDSEIPPSPIRQFFIRNHQEGWVRIKSAMALLQVLKGHLHALVEREGVELSTLGKRGEKGEEVNSSWSSLETPRHTFLVMVVGTRGDVEPLISLALQLKVENHEVYFATHVAYRENVVGAGLSFLPLAGDPEILSGFAVKWSDSSTSLRESFEILQAHAEGVREMLFSSWEAICESGVIPDVIISNPVTFTHAHIAESCGSSLHIAFPQPWVPTASFPHPLLATESPSIPAGLYEEGKKNALSHQLADRMLYHGTEANINELRTTKLDLKSASIGEGHWKVIPGKKVPFSVLFSESLLLRPDDWEDHIKICGSVCQRCTSDTAIDGPSELPEPLESFLVKRSSPVVYVGFGSMVLPRLTLDGVISNLLQAAAINDVRIVVQLQSWSLISESNFRDLAAQASKSAQLIKQADQNELWFDYIVSMAMMSVLSSPTSTEALGEETFPSCPVAGSRSVSQSWTESESAFLLVGSLDHSKLFDRVAALVHHGGAGTTFQGLRQGRPTWILPCFGDQRMWGVAVHERGAGPPPVAPQNVTLSQAADSFRHLLSDSCREAAQSLKKALCEEDGAQQAALHVKESLPLAVSLCTLSLLVGEVRLAEVHCAHCDLNMTLEAFERSHESDIDLSWHTPGPVAFADWSPTEPKTLIKGLNVGVKGLLRCLAGGIYDSLASPARGAMDGGIYGAMRGVVKGCSSLIGSTQDGSAVFASKVHKGVMGGRGGQLRFCFPGSGGEGAQMKFHQMMSRRCCEEQMTGRLYPSIDEAEERPGEHDLDTRTLSFKTAHSVARSLQRFMSSVRDKGYVTLSESAFTYCLHSDELLAEVESLQKISQVRSVTSSSTQSDCWSPFMAYSSEDSAPSDSSIASSDFFTSACPMSSSIPTISEEDSLLSLSRSKDRIYLNDLALHV